MGCPWHGGGRGKGGGGTERNTSENKTASVGCTHARARGITMIKATPSGGSRSEICFAPRQVNLALASCTLHPPTRFFRVRLPLLFGATVKITPTSVTGSGTERFIHGEYVIVLTKLFFYRRKRICHGVERREFFKDKKMYSNIQIK